MTVVIRLLSATYIRPNAPMEVFSSEPLAAKSGTPVQTCTLYNISFYLEAVLSIVPRKQEVPLGK